MEQCRRSLGCGRLKLLNPDDVSCDEVIDQDAAQDEKEPSCLVKSSSRLRQAWHKGP